MALITIRPQRKALVWNSEILFFFVKQTVFSRPLPENGGMHQNGDISLNEPCIRLTLQIAKHFGCRVIVSLRSISEGVRFAENKKNRLKIACKLNVAI